MGQSIQPASMRGDEASLIHNFGLENVLVGLERAAVAGSEDPLLENEHARLLFCADSFDPPICDKVRIVHSTKGLAIGINVQNQDSLFSQEDFESFLENMMSRDLKG